LLARLKRITPASAVRHSVRILTIVAKASFWALCYHYFGSKTLLYVVASWTFLLGVKDVTFVRVRLSSIKNPKKRSRGYMQSVSAELVLIALRIGAIFALSALVAPFNKNVAVRRHNTRLMRSKEQTNTSLQLTAAEQKQNFTAS